MLDRFYNWVTDLGSFGSCLFTIFFIALPWGLVVLLALYLWGLHAF